LAIKQQRLKGEKKDRVSFWLRLVLLAAFFAAGVILGRVLSDRAPEGTAAELAKYLTGYFSLEQTEELSAKSILSALLIYFRYPLLAFLFGLVAAGIVLLPVLSAAFGFFLSFSVCCFTAAFGQSGVLLALSAIGIRCFVTMPCFFYLAVPSMERAWMLAGASFSKGKRLSRPAYSSNLWLRLGIASALLLAGSMAELFLTPFLLHLALSKILSL
jgi:stage II sporulation protein M